MIPLPFMISAISIVQTAPPSIVVDLPASTIIQPSQGVSDLEVTELEEVVVLGRRGSTHLRPEVELGEAEIDALGAYDIGEAITRISRNLGFPDSPVIIVNGRRALNSGDFTRFPPDALVRVEALPPEAGAIYGGDPSRRVLNIVLQSQFKSRDGLLNGARPTAGGRSSLMADLRQSEIHDNTTRQFGVVVSRDTALRAEERPDYSSDHLGAGGLTLRPASDSLSANFSTTAAIGDWSGSLNSTAEVQNSRFVFMREGQAIEAREQSRSLTATGGLGGKARGWLVQLGLDAKLSKARQSGIVDFQSLNLSTAAKIGADRTLMDLPAGPLRTSLNSQFSYAETLSHIGESRTRLSTKSMDISGTLLIPLSRPQPPQENHADFDWGDISAIVGGSMRGIAGTSTSGEGINFGLNWSPTQKVRFSTLWSLSTDSPSDEQRFAPVTYGPPVVVFDFLTGEAVDILPIIGGNPDLQPQKSQSFSASISAGPYTSWQMLGSVSFTGLRSTDGISGLPAFTPELEAAFPDRFVRDGDGRLINIDQRPVNLASDASESLSSNLNFNIPISATPALDAAYLQLGVSHTFQISNRLTIHPGLPSMDRLAGDGGGVSRHQVSFYVDGRYRKWGLNAGANWRSASRIRRDSGQDGSDDLRLGDFARVDLKLSYVFDLPNSSNPTGERARRYQGLRMELAVENLFDARPEATLGDGGPAPGYGRDDQDPLGRVVRLTVSRRF